MSTTKSRVTPGSRTVVFLHGGPGFNSAPEQAALTPLFRDRGMSCLFWNEPSRLRPSGDPFVADKAYDRWLASAERLVVQGAAQSPVVLVAHSFSVHAALALARRHPRLVASLVLIAPGADAFRTFHQVLVLTRQTYESVHDDRALAVSTCLTQTRTLFDAPMRAGFELASGAEGLFDHYWVNKDAHASARLACEGPETGFDGESFFSVLADIASRPGVLASVEPIRQPILAVFGEADVVTPQAYHESALREIAPRLEIAVIRNAAHYPHLEAADRVMDIIERWMSGAGHE